MLGQQLAPHGHVDTSVEEIHQLFERKACPSSYHG
jgi:hypothetical protein